MTGARGPAGPVRILSEAGGAMTLDRLRDPATGARLAPVRADGRAVAGLPEGRTAPLLAIVDTGLDSSHPWIARTLAGSVDLTGQGAEDRNGHGTWVALSMLASYPMPAGLLNVKALADDGAGSLDQMSRGIRRAADRGATLINVSAGVSQPWCQADCPLCQAALAAAAGGIPVFAAAGNVGGETTCPAKAGVLQPGCGVTASGAMNIGQRDLGPQSYSGIGNYYGVDTLPILLPVRPGDAEPDDPDPRYRAASASTLIRQGVNAASAGLFDQAARSFDELVARWGGDAAPEVRAYAGRALLDKGYMFHRNGRPQDALACYGSVVERYGADPPEVMRDVVYSARVRRATLLEQLGDTAGALAVYGEIIGAPPPGPAPSGPEAWARLKRGFLLRALGRPDEADADLRMARASFEQGAQAGDARAMYNLGVLLQAGDAPAARGWYEKAAQAGHTDAMYNLGVMLARSEPGMARSWYEQAARSGHVRAMYNLGLMLADSEPGTSHRWFEQAAQFGHAGAMYNVGLDLWDSDPAAARRWIEQAAQAGSNEARSFLANLA